MRSRRAARAADALGPLQRAPPPLVLLVQAPRDVLGRLVALRGRRVSEVAPGALLRGGRRRLAPLRKLLLPRGGDALRGGQRGLGPPLHARDAR